MAVGESSTDRSGGLVGESEQHLAGECSGALVSERQDIPEVLSIAEALEELIVCMECF